MSLIKLNNQNFEEVILGAEGIALVDFYADWCGPCKMLSPVIDALAQEKDDIIIGKVNVDESGELAAKYGVMSIPTLIVFKDGKEVNRSLGFKPKNAILSLLEV